MDEYEKETLEALEKIEIGYEPPSQEMLDMLAEAGRNTFKKDKRINIRLTRHDLEGIQRKAARKGIPYQVLISSLIHQYVEGDLKEAEVLNEAR
ncbi:MAG: hypothetical protein ACOCVG_02095 [Verrucomicrobiota bacterium]